jgi:exodeoxyribonuclease VII large subunit
MERAAVSLIILARGGGSAEDLSVFNREEIVEAVYRCPIPVISAIGHETDISLTDLAADLRAPTPSAAAEMAVPIKEELLASLRQMQNRLQGETLRTLGKKRERLQIAGESTVLTQPKRLWEAQALRLENLKRSIVFTQPTRLLDPHKDMLSRFQERLRERSANLILEAANRMNQEVIKLEALSPLATLARGYAICLDGDGHVLFDAAGVNEDDPVQVRLSKGALRCKIMEIINQ